MTDKLTHKQDLFKTLLPILNGNQTKAAELAGYKGGYMACAQRGHELVKNSKVKKAIDKEKARIKEKIDVEVEEIVARLKQIGLDPDYKANNADILRACELLGKYKQMFVDVSKTEHSFKGYEPVDVPGQANRARTRLQEVQNSA